MSEPLTIALDAMGGDNAPEIVLQGADIARRRFPDVRFMVYGDEAKITPLLGRMANAAPNLFDVDIDAGDTVLVGGALGDVLLIDGPQFSLLQIGFPP